MILDLYPAEQWLEAVDSIFIAEHSRAPDYTAARDLEECASILEALEEQEAAEQWAQFE